MDHPTKTSEDARHVSKDTPQTWGDSEAAFGHSHVFATTMSHQFEVRSVRVSFVYVFPCRPCLAGCQLEVPSNLWEGYLDLSPRLVEVTPPWYSIFSRILAVACSVSPVIPTNMPHRSAVGFLMSDGANMPHRSEVGCFMSGACAHFLSAPPFGH